MTARIDIIAPATITLPETGTSSLADLPPGGIFIADPGDATLGVTLIATNVGATLSAGSAGGATISSNANTLVISGAQPAVNAALASLEIAELSGPTTDTILITASDPAVLAARTDIAVAIGAAGRPAFVAPPATFTATAYTLATLAGLVLADPAALALDAAGQGRQQTLEITLAVASGLLLLPSLSSLGGIAATGVGTNKILLAFTADQIAAVNALLAGLQYVGPAATTGLVYGLRDLSGPLGGAITSGNITINVTGNQGPPETVTSGVDIAILGVTTLAAGSTLTIAGITADLGGIGGAGALAILPDAALVLPYNALALDGTSYDFGSLSAGAVTESGALLAAAAVDFGGLFNLGPGGLIDVAGVFQAGAAAPFSDEPALSLGAGALLTGGGTLQAGNVAEAGDIFGAGTIAVTDGETLVIAAASLSGDTLDIGGGGVMVLGPVDAPPLTIAPSVTLAFGAQSAVNPVGGGLADTLGGSGGVIVITEPAAFSGTLTNFAAGDRLIFPGLTGLTLLNINTATGSFEVAGNNSNNVTQYFTFYAATPPGASLYASTDAQGDSEVGLRDPGTDVFVDGVPANTAFIAAKTTTPQPIQGLNVLLRSWTTQSLTLSLEAGAGTLALGTLQGASLAVTAASPEALNATLAGLLYTANLGASFDALTVASSSGLLAGLNDVIPIDLNNSGGTVSGFGNAGQAALFTGGALRPITGNAASGALIITGPALFADALDIPGLSGTALVINNAATGIFDAGANVALGADVTIGDFTGPGALDVITDAFSVTGNVTLGGLEAVPGSAADIAGTLGVTGSLAMDESSLDLTGALAVAAVVIGGGGLFTGFGTASAALGAAVIAGTFALNDLAQAQDSSLVLLGTAALGGTSRLTIAGALTTGGSLAVGPDATLTAGSVAQIGGSVFLAGLLAAGSIAANGAITLAGGTLVAPQVALNGAATLSGAGYLGAGAGLGTIQLAGGTIDATGALLLADDIFISNGGAITIGASAALDAVHEVIGGTISFQGTAAELTINDVAQFSAAVTGLVAHDVIDLIGEAPSLVSYTGGTIHAKDPNRVALGGFVLTAATLQPGVSIVSDGHGGALITLGGDMPCFARGTRLLTPNGYTPVERFTPGDPVITRDGARRAVRWIGRRTLAVPGRTAAPVCFAAGALGPGVPLRAVKLSPLHAVFIDGVLVPALHLVNGATIVQTADTAVTYYHIELDRHDIVLAEGMAAETYIDTGNRGNLYYEQGRRGKPGVPCAPLVTRGPKLAAIRRRLHAVALAAGYTLTYAPGLRGIAGDAALLPRQSRRGGRRLARFTLPPGTRRLGLVARGAAPAETDPESEDRRILGVCLAGLPAGVRLAEGFLPRAAADEGVWMGPSGGIWLPANARSLTLRLAAVVQSWRPPAVDLGAARF